MMRGLTTVVLLAITALIPVNASNLRFQTNENNNGNGNDRQSVNDRSTNHHRRLQLAPLVNQIIFQMSPLMHAWVHDQLTAFESFALGTPKTVHYNHTDFNGLCSTETSLTYGLSQIEGLNKLVLNDIEMVQGTDFIQASLWGLSGAEWGGDWLFNGTFPSITAKTSMQMNVSLCGIPLEQTLNGIFTINNTNLAGIVGFQGSTKNQYSFMGGEELFRADSSTMVTPKAKSLVLQLGSISTDFGFAGTAMGLASNRQLERAAVEDFTRDLEPLLLKVLNKILVEQSPMPLHSTID